MTFGKHYIGLPQKSSISRLKSCVPWGGLSAGIESILLTVRYFESEFLSTVVERDLSCRYCSSEIKKAPISPRNGKGLGPTREEQSPNLWSESDRLKYRDTSALATSDRSLENHGFLTHIRNHTNSTPEGRRKVKCACGGCFEHRQLTFN